MEHSTEIFLMKTWSRELRLSDRAEGFIFQRDNDPMHTVKSTQEWLRGSSDFECP